MTKSRLRAADTPMNERDELFCREYIVDFNGSHAAIRAGVPEKGARVQACRLLARPEVQERVALLMAERAERTGIDADWVVTRLQTVVERCMQETPVTRDGKPVMVETPSGETAAAYQFDAAGATRALDLLGKHAGIFEKDNQQRGLVMAEDIIRALDERDQRAGAKQHGNAGTDGPGGATGA